MKKITLLLSFIACVVFAQAQLLYNENFNYTVGSALIGQGGWTLTNSTTNPLTVSANSLTYTNYPSSGVGGQILMANNGQDAYSSFTTKTSGAIYYSALVNLSAAQAAGDYFLHVGEPLSTSVFFGRTFAKLDGTNVAFGILNTSSASPAVATPTYTTSTYALNTTYLIVVKVDLSTTAAVSSLIVNPDMSAEPTTGWITNSNGTNVLSANGIGEINLRQGSASNAPTLAIDGIRVATSYTALFTATGLNSLSTTPLSVSVKGNVLTVNAVEEGSMIDIYSTVGAKVQSSKLVSGSVLLNDLAKGLYVVRVGNASSKIML